MFYQVKCELTKFVRLITTSRPMYAQMHISLYDIYARHGLYILVGVVCMAGANPFRIYGTGLDLHSFHYKIMIPVENKPNPIANVHYS